MKVSITLGRSVREYVTVIVEAPSVAEAESYCEALLASEEDSEAYADLVNAGTWRSESDSVSDEDVISAEVCEDDDDEADIIVP